MSRIDDYSDQQMIIASAIGKIVKKGGRVYPAISILGDALGQINRLEKAEKKKSKANSR